LIDQRNARENSENNTLDGNNVTSKGSRPLMIDSTINIGTNNQNNHLVDDFDVDF